MARDAQQNGNTTQAIQILQGAGYKREEIMAILSNNAKEGTRMSLTQGAYDARSLSKQLGVPMDKNDLYNEMHQELSKIAAEDGTVSMFDVERAARIVAERKGYGGGGQLDWNEARQYSNRVIGIDENQNKIANAEFMGNMPEVVVYGNPMRTYEVSVGTYGQELCTIDDNGNYRTQYKGMTPKQAQAQLQNMYAANDARRQALMDRALNPDYIKASHMGAYLSRADIRNAGITPLVPEQANAHPGLVHGTNMVIGQMALAGPAVTYGNAAAAGITNSMLRSGAQWGISAGTGGTLNVLGSLPYNPNMSAGDVAITFGVGAVGSAWGYGMGMAKFDPLKTALYTGGGLFTIDVASQAYMNNGTINLTQSTFKFGLGFGASMFGSFVGNNMPQTSPGSWQNFIYNDTVPAGMSAVYGLSTDKFSDVWRYDIRLWGEEPK